MFVIPLDLTVTAPLDTEKSSLLKLAIPLLDVVASSPAKVIVPEPSVTSIPSPAVNVIVPPKAVAVEFEPSVTVIDEFDNLAFAIEPANWALVIVPVNDDVG